MTKYTRAKLEHRESAIEYMQKARNELNQLPLTEADVVIAEEALAQIEDTFQIETTEYHFILCLQEQAAKEHGLLLADDGTLDTLLYCPKCQGHLRFDGRESAIMHTEDDDECWLCPGEEN